MNLRQTDVLYLVATNCLPSIRNEWKHAVIEKHGGEDKKPKLHSERLYITETLQMKIMNTAKEIVQVKCSKTKFKKDLHTIQNHPITRFCWRAINSADGYYYIVIVTLLPERHEN